MQFKSLAISLAAVLPLVSAYPITGNDVNCREGPGTNHKVIKTYAKGTDVKVTCQTNGESVSGSSIWDKTGDNCYVSDLYVKTGSSGMVVGECGGGTKPPSGGSSYNGKISRKEILERANYWVSRHIPYSMSKTYPDSQGRRYRTDCSGFVSMALHANSPGYSTVSLPEIAKPISWSDIKPGDLVGTLGPGTGGAAGHVTLFKEFTDKTKKQYRTLECRGSQGCVSSVRPVGWKDGKFTSKPYRYIRVTD
ncbi:NlpC/P60-like cell-wall peptidase [Purpureocillium lavendulum]|uniref:NlpC/P60-like cell-wall peptidase n=1 Tax=Purpureocillium lavendulum TaxID=1247861 RepID=A0AB34FW46_9HYPO|nr:NlpC/P60-like cell-wall peptidase [Purpureocillium lavendulum]